MTNNTPHKKFIFAVLIIGLLFWFNVNICAYMYQNGSGIGFVDSGDGEGDSTTIAALCSYNVVEYYVIKGAGFFLSANSDIQQLLSRIELSSIYGFDSGELLNITNRALFNMNLAKETYYFLIKIAEATPYNEIVIAKLIDFDYDSFKRQINAPNEIFKEIADYLKRGDITGNYKRSYRKFIEIIGILQQIQSEIKLKGMPDISVLWSLNQEFQKTLLEGQYVSQIFSEISDNKF